MTVDNVMDIHMGQSPAIGTAIVDIPTPVLVATSIFDSKDDHVIDDEPHHVIYSCDDHVQLTMTIGYAALDERCK